MLGCRRAARSSADMSMMKSFSVNVWIRAHAIISRMARASIPSHAMVGGAPPAADGAGRSVVMILGSGGTACTATAVAHDLLLTAAHCVQPGSDYKLVVGATGQRPDFKEIVRVERDPQ